MPTSSRFAPTWILMTGSRGRYEIIDRRPAQRHSSPGSYRTVVQGSLTPPYFLHTAATGSCGTLRHTAAYCGRLWHTAAYCGTGCHVLESKLIDISSVSPGWICFSKVFVEAKSPGIFAYCQHVGKKSARSCLPASVLSNRVRFHQNN